MPVSTLFRARKFVGIQLLTDKFCTDDVDVEFNIVPYQQRGFGEII